MIAHSVIERVLDRADIADVIGGYISLKKTGSDFVACCPFHKEKTPSFHVNRTRQTWHCFGACQEGGNAISFVMKHESITFPEAVRSLARRYGIEVEEETEEPAAMQKRLKLEALMMLNERVAKWFRANLLRKEFSHALDYANSRWGNRFVKESDIGYAPKESSAIFNWALQTGENRELLLELGILKANRDTGSYYGAYRDRLVIPIRNRTGAIIGFTARDLSGKDDCPKYINSQESELYHKKETLFGLDVAFREACKHDLIYLVEGAADAMKMHSVGILNVCAPLGGIWSKEQFALLKKCTKNVCFLNDADVVPPGKKYGTRIQFVINNGSEAVRLGLNVTIKT